MPGSKSPEVRARMAQRQVKIDQQTATIGELRLAGLSFRQVAEGANCSLSTAHEGWKRFRRSLQRGDVESEREVLCGRLERQYRQLGSKLSGGDVQAHRVGVQILELMAVVLGLEAPRRMAVDVQGPPMFTRFEFVLEPLPTQPGATVEPEPDGPRLEDGPRRLLAPAERPEGMEEAS